MGKTKTAFVSGDTDSKSGEEKYKEKQKKKAEAMAPKAKGDKKGAQKVKLSGLKGGQRVVAIEAEPILSEDTEEGSGKKKKAPKVRSPKYKEAKAKFDPKKLFKTKEAIKLVKDTSYSKFDGTVELHLVVKKQGISANVTLPHSAGKEKKIEVASEKTLDKLAKGKIDFDVLLATPDLMPKLVPYAKLLGPKGLMPNPKNGTLIKDKKEAKNFGGNTVTIKTERKAPLIHTSVGKVSQAQKELEENTESVLNGIGIRQIVKAYIKATMGPSVKLEI